MNERLYTARSILEKERDELQKTLNKKMQEYLRMEQQLHQRVVEQGRPRMQDSEVTGLLKAFDLFSEVRMASKETQTESTQNLLCVPSSQHIQMIDASGKQTAVNPRKIAQNKQLYSTLLPLIDRDNTSNLVPRTSMHDDEPGSPFLIDQSETSSVYNEQMQNVEMNENILIGSRSQASSFVVQGDRIQALEAETLGLNAQIQRLQSQIKTAAKEKERVLKEKENLEARMKSEIAEKLK